MKIAITSTQNNGKDYLIDSFLKTWPMYSQPEKTYRDLIKSGNLDLNEDGTESSQRIIRDALADQAIQNNGETHCIHNRCILDNLAYTLWLYDKGAEISQKFIAESFAITKTILPMYDIIFYLPIRDESPVIFVDRDDRSNDLTFRDEIDNILAGIYSSWRENTGVIFPEENSPAMVEIYGDEEMGHKTGMIAEYIGPEGDVIDPEEKSVLQSLEKAMALGGIEKMISGGGGDFPKLFDE